MLGVVPRPFFTSGCFVSRFLWPLFRPFCWFVYIYLTLPCLVLLLLRLLSSFSASPLGCCLQLRHSSRVTVSFRPSWMQHCWKLHCLLLDMVAVWSWFIRPLLVSCCVLVPSLCRCLLGQICCLLLLLLACLLGHFIWTAVSLFFFCLVPTPLHPQ